MKLTQTLVLTAQVASMVAAKYMPQYGDVADWTNYSDEDPSAITLLEGEEALTYLFDYNPSRRHRGDTGPTEVLDEKAGIDNRTVQYEYWSNYDTEYLGRVCAPRFATGEAARAWENSPLNDIRGGGPSMRELSLSYDYGLKIERAMAADSPYPCERVNWIQMECGINPLLFGKDFGAFGEQNKCLCESDGYWEASKACQACYDLHTGNATLAAEEKELQSSYSSSICTETGTPAKELDEVRSSIYAIQSNQARPNITIVSDGAPGKTDVSLYYTGGVDFVPATIREPEFTRTAGAETIVMTPGSAVAKATAAAGTGSTETASKAVSAAPAAPSTAGVADMKTSGGLMVAAFGALFML